MQIKIHNEKYWKSIGIKFLIDLKNIAKNGIESEKIILVFK